MATYYRAGVEGTQVGGDWYDVIELGGGRTALVVGDVMGRGVRAAAVMGQLRAAVRAYARLDLPPADLLESLDGLVRELGEDQIVTCIYAVFDPADRVLRFANAGHLPPIVRDARRRAAGWSGRGEPAPGRRPLQPAPSTRSNLDLGRHAWCSTPTAWWSAGARTSTPASRRWPSTSRDLTGPSTACPRSWSRRCCPTGPTTTSRSWWRGSTRRRREREPVSAGSDCDEPRSAEARHLVTTTSRPGRAGELVEDAALVTSELVTNAALHGRPPVELRLRLEGDDRADRGPGPAPPTSRASCAPTEDDEHGRGLQIVAALADPLGHPSHRARQGGVVRPVGPLVSGPDRPWLPLRFRDLDAFGHVYHAEYLTLLDEGPDPLVR